MLQASERGVVADLVAVASVGVLPVRERIAAPILEQFAEVVLRVSEAASEIRRNFSGDAL